MIGLSDIGSSVKLVQLGPHHSSIVATHHEDGFDQSGDRLNEAMVRLVATDDGGNQVIVLFTDKLFSWWLKDLATVIEKPTIAWGENG